MASAEKNGVHPDDIPRPVDGIDVTSLSLSPEEGFVFSRIDGKTPVKSLTMLTGFKEQAVAAAVTRLRMLGVVLIGAEKPQPQKQPEATAGDPYAGVVFNLVDLGEEIDITEEKKKRILLYEMKLGEWHHYELLGLGREAGAGDVRKAYFRASKEFHPDAFFRKNLGSYKKRVETIFKAMKVAYDVLSNDDTRKAYCNSIVWPLSPKEEAQIAFEVRRKQREQKRQTLIKTRRLKKNPMLARIKRAGELFELGVAALKAENFQEAANHLRLAVTYHPQKKKYQRRYSEAASTANLLRAQNILKNVEVALETGDNEILIQGVEEAVRLVPSQPEVMAKAAEYMLEIGEVRRAFEIAQRAVGYASHNEPALTVLANAAEHAQKWNVAIRSVEKLIALRPKDPGMKSRLKKLKRNLL